MTDPTHYRLGSYHLTRTSPDPALWLCETRHATVPLADLDQTDRRVLLTLCYNDRATDNRWVIDDHREVRREPSNDTFWLRDRVRQTREPFDGRTHVGLGLITAALNAWAADATPEPDKPIDRRPIEFPALDDALESIRYAFARHLVLDHNVSPSDLAATLRCGHGHAAQIIDQIRRDA